MTVYVITESDYDYTNILGVVGSEEEAKRITATFTGLDYEEHEVTDDFDIPDDGDLQPFLVLMNGLGQITTRRATTPSRDMVWAKNEREANALGWRDALDRRFLWESPLKNKIRVEMERTYGHG